MTPFPTLIDGHHVERAVINACVKWAETFIAEAERQNGLDAKSLPVPHRGHFTTVGSEFAKYAETQTPAVLVVAPGLTGSLRRETDRTYTAPVGIALGVICESPFEGYGREAAQIIAAALSQIILSAPLEGIEVDDIELINEQYNDVARQDERTIGSSRVGFTIWVRKWRGFAPLPLAAPGEPAEPPDDPYEQPAERHRLEHVHATVNGGSN